MNENNEIIRDSKQNADIFNKHFINCVERIIPQNHISINTNINMHIQKPFIMNNTNTDEIINIITNLNRRSAVGYDEISTNFCMFFKHNLSISLTNLINSSLANGIFPDALKIGKVSPILKSGNKFDCNNYRPITVLTIFSKVFETVIYLRLNNHLHKNRIISANQYGFCSNSSTLAAVSHLINNVKSFLDQRLYTSCLFIDFTKAFDSVNHEILIKKIELLGITGNFLRLIKSYLKDRNQFVNIDGSTSESLKVKFGVPQGSQLGPLLFNIFINDVESIGLTGKLTIYADDIALTYGEKSLTELNFKMQNDIDKLLRWTTNNKLKMNELKTKWMIFTTKNKNINLHNFEIIIDKHKLERVKEIKYLGLWIDDMLTWSNHISTVRDRIRKINFILYQLRKSLPSNIKQTIFHTHILSKVRYLLPIWGSTYNSNLTEIFTQINRSLKIIKNLPILTPSLNLYSLNILPIKTLVDYEILLFIFKIKNNLIKNQFNIKTVDSMHSYYTRQSKAYVIPFCRTTGGQNNIVTKGLNRFNKLPNELQDELRISIFKKKLKTYLYNKIAL